MKEKPVVFTSEEVRATLEGRKTQFRRSVKQQPPEGVGKIFVDEYHPALINKDGELFPGEKIFGAYDEDGEWGTKCPFGKVGDELWVRETWVEWAGINCPCGYYGHECKCDKSLYKADPESDFANECGPIEDKLKWKSSASMPRWASRIQLKVIDVRVEQVQDIDEEDAKAEGIWVDSLHDLKSFLHPNKEYFKILWDSICTKKSLGWDDNPWVWVVEFEVINE